MTEQTFILHNRVKQLRHRLDVRQTDLAKEAGVTRQTIIAIEKERLNPSITLCLKIARVLREPVDYVFYLERSSAAQQAARPSEPPPPPKPPPPPPALKPRPTAKPGAPTKPAASPARPTDKQAPKPRPRSEDESPQSVFDFG